VPYGSPVRVALAPEITQRDLRTRPREIMDAVKHGQSDTAMHGQSDTVTRDGHRIGELIPLRQRPPVRLPAGLHRHVALRSCCRTGRVSRPIRTWHSTIRPASRVSAEQPQQRMRNANIVIVCHWIDPAQLPD
jgi:hypothetical protein